MIPHAFRAGVASRDAAWLISILGFGSLAGRLVLGHAADRLGRQRILGVLHVALGMLFLTWTIRVGFVTLALFAFAYGVCYGATIALRPAVIADHFAGPDLAAVTGLHYTSSGARTAGRSRGVRVFARLLEQRFDCELRGGSLPDRRRLFLRSKTTSSSTTSSGHLPASAAPCENAGPYRFPAFGAADRLIVGEGLLSLGKVTNLPPAAYGHGRVGPRGG
jgi:hypothetical protein